MAKSSLTLGINYYNQKRYEQALSFFLSMSTEEGAGDDLDISYYLGLCYTKLSRFEDALVYLEQVVTHEKTGERANQCRLILAFIYANSGRESLANFELDTLSNENYKPSSILSAKAFLAYEKSDVETALDYYEKALVLDSDNIAALNGIGYVLASEGRDLAKALSACKKAADLHGDYAIYDSLGFIYQKLGMNEKSKEYLELALSLSPNNETIKNHILTLRQQMESK